MSRFILYFDCSYFNLFKSSFFFVLFFIFCQDFFLYSYSFMLLFILYVSMLCALVFSIPFFIDKNQKFNELNVWFLRWIWETFLECFFVFFCMTWRQECVCITFDWQYHDHDSSIVHTYVCIRTILNNLTIWHSHLFFPFFFSFRSNG